MKFNLSQFSFLKKNRSNRRSGFIYPARDWKIIIWIFVVLCVFSAIGHYYLYVSIDTLELSDVNLQPIKTLRRVALLEIIKEYSQKESEFNALLQMPPGGIEPI